MTVAVTIVAALLAAAATLVVIRLVRGPSVLDRVVALDTVLAIIVCGLATTAAYTGDSTTVPVLVVVSLLGFMGSVAVAGSLGPRESTGDLDAEGRPGPGVLPTGPVDQPPGAEERS
jgi:multicomponent Na+:H+ antiporter subunit F